MNMRVKFCFSIRACTCTKHNISCNLYIITVRPTGNGVGRINEVALRRARLVLRWVTVRGNIVLVCNQPRGLTQPRTLKGNENDYRPKNSGSAICGWEARSESISRGLYGLSGLRKRYEHPAKAFT